MTAHTVRLIVGVGSVRLGPAVLGVRIYEWGSPSRPFVSNVVVAARVFGTKFLRFGHNFEYCTEERFDFC